MKTLAPCRSRLRRSALALLAVLAALLPVGDALGQIVVSLKMDEPSWVLHQEITGTISIKNNSGRDFILEGPNGTSWITFDVSDPNDKRVSPRGSAPKVSPLFVRRGETVSKKIPLNLFYRFSELGIYGVTPYVYFSPTGRHISGARRPVRTSDAKPFWQETVGVPSEEGVVEYRRISMLVYQEKERKRLFMRVSDPKTGRVFGTRLLGRILAFRDPQITIDGENRIHVLFLTGPKIWLHAIALADGSVLKPDVYREDGSNRPAMHLSQSGRVKIHGGFFEGGSEPIGGWAANPAESRRTVSQVDGGPGPGGIRSLSERPGAVIRQEALPSVEQTIPRAVIVED